MPLGCWAPPSPTLFLLTIGLPILTRLWFDRTHLNLESLISDPGHRHTGIPTASAKDAKLRSGGGSAAVSDGFFLAIQGSLAVAVAVAAYLKSNSPWSAALFSGFSTWLCVVW